MFTCPLCFSAQIDDFFRDRQREYLRCRACAFIFVPPAYFLPESAEKAEYDLHRNTPDDPKYRQFLKRVFSPLHAQIGPNSRGLDFGSGPGPTLSVMCEEAGHTMTLYDPFYAPDSDALQAAAYDFITATEVFEHLRQPRHEVDRLWTCLKPGGVLAVMTGMARSVEAFAAWRYIRDRTHIGFFSESTMQWLAAHWQATLTQADRDVWFFRKPERQEFTEVP